MDTTIPDKVVVWAFDGRPGNLKSQNNYSTDHNGNGYNMHCQTNNQFLSYEKQSVGINLGYTNSAGEHKIHLRLPDGKDREILSGESVAFGIGGGDAFLKYAHRTIGINLDWAKNPVFEWRVYTRTGEKGKPLPIGEPVAVINDKVEPTADFLVYLDRPVGGDVGWTTSPDWKGKITDWLTTEGFQKLIQVLTK